MGGALSWSEPAAWGSPPASPFPGLPVPPDALVDRQVLAEPSIDLPDRKTWARLADGTPLVTAEERDEGRIVLVHTTANPDWSNLALSGLFVEMLRRITALSEGVSGDMQAATFAPIEVLDGQRSIGAAARHRLPDCPATGSGPMASGARVILPDLRHGGGRGGRLT